jgi:HD-GYP domain-containing protein (c-di-GMP phosphodiesterase class II)
MILTSLEDVYPGMVLGVGLRNKEGHTLLGPGVTLTPEYISRLTEIGYAAVWVDDEDTRDIPYEDSLSENTRVNTTRSIEDTFNMTSREVESLRAVSTKEIKGALENKQFQDAFRDHPIVDRMSSQVDALVGEVLDRAVLTGLGSMRTQNTYTFHHCVDTAVTATMLGRYLGYDRETLKKLAIGCILHDVGNTFVDNAVLNKTEGLNVTELARMRDHTVLGYLFLRDSLKVGVVPAHVAYQHHERQDGTGYPRGLTGNNKIGHGPDVNVPGRISPLGEVAAIADYHDACSSDRPHRGRMAPDEVWQTIRSAAGSHLNKEMVDLFLSLTPPYPMGTQIMVTDGQRRGYSGVVVSARREALDRPLVRLLYDETGERVEASDVDLRKDPSKIKGITRQRMSDAKAQELEAVKS